METERLLQNLKPYNCQKTVMILDVEHLHTTSHKNNLSYQNYSIVGHLETQ